MISHEHVVDRVRNMNVIEHRALIEHGSARQAETTQPQEWVIVQIAKIDTGSKYRQDRREAAK